MTKLNAGYGEKFAKTASEIAKVSDNKRREMLKGSGVMGSKSFKSFAAQTVDNKRLMELATKASTIGK